MRTKIQCGWLVGYAGSGHVLWRDAELVYEGTQIVFVGERFDGTADQVIDADGRQRRFRFTPVCRRPRHVIGHRR